MIQCNIYPWFRFGFMNFYLFGACCICVYIYIHNQLRRGNQTTNQWLHFLIWEYYFVEWIRIVEHVPRFGPKGVCHCYHWSHALVFGAGRSGRDSEGKAQAWEFSAAAAGQYIYIDMYVCCEQNHIHHILTFLFYCGMAKSEAGWMRKVVLAWMLLMRPVPVVYPVFNMV